KQLSHRKTKVYAEELDAETLLNLIKNPEAYLRARGLEVSKRATRGTFSVTVSSQFLSRPKESSIASEGPLKCRYFTLPLIKILAGDSNPSVIGYKTFVSCK